MLSVDPSSPFTRGAVLGDRIRLSDHFLDPGVFIRSMASRGALGGLAEAALQAALLMDAAGKDDVLLETVGVGQGEIDVVDHADTIVLALMPGSGDSIQALKAGRDGDPRRDRRQQGRPPARRHDGPRGPGRPRARAAALVAGAGRAHRGGQRRGVAELVETIGEHRAHIEEEGTLNERRARNLRAEVLGIAAARMRRELEEPRRAGPRVGRAPRQRRPARDGPGDRRAQAARKIARWLTRRPRTAARPTCRLTEARTRSEPGSASSSTTWAAAIGKVEGAYVDDESGEPEWLLARMGRFGHHCLVPARDAVAAGGHVWVPYTRDQIRKAPRHRRRQAARRATAEQQLLDHYGIGTGEVGRGPSSPSATRSAITARPAVAPSSPSCPAITICWTSSVPSPMVRILASR